MNQTRELRVLIIDDDDMEAFVALLRSRGLSALHVTPDELEEAHLEDVQVVLVDEYLNKWDRRESVVDAVGLYVRDGIALAAVLRSHLDNRGPAENVLAAPKDTSIVLRTGRLDVLAAGTPRYMQPVIVSRQHDLEWAVRKEDGGTEAAIAAIEALASAVLTLPKQWNGIGTEGLCDWLGLGDQAWKEAALEQIEECRPPWSVLAASSAGRKWIAWFLQRILPFPTFLIDDLRAAAYLGLSGPALDVLLENEGIVGELLQSSLYVGELSKFGGRRWWRAGIQEIRRFVISESHSPNHEDFFDALCRVSERDLTDYRLAVRYPVFEIDDDYNVVKDPIEIENAVRLQPDEWPSYADFPWLDRRTLADCSTDLKKIIVIDDHNEQDEM